jgi:hypothetical protein
MRRNSCGESARNRARRLPRFPAAPLIRTFMRPKVSG